MTRDTTNPQPPRLLQQARNRIRRLHYSWRTGQASIHWIRFFVLASLSGRYRLMASLMYGAGLRLAGCLRLRVQDLDFGYRQVVVRSGKGAKDRIVPFPESLAGGVREQIEAARRVREADLADGCGEVSLPRALARKYPNAGTEPGWWYLLPSASRSVDPVSGQVKRHPIDPSRVQRAFKQAVCSPVDTLAGGQATGIGSLVATPLPSADGA